MLWKHANFRQWNTDGKYGSERLEGLRAVSGKHDPECMFQRRVERVQARLMIWMQRKSERLDSQINTAPMFPVYKVV